MSAFEHVIVLLSFVYALALTHLLLCIAELIRASARVQFSWTFAFWVANAFLTIIANWIGFWDLRTLPSFTMATVFFTFCMAFVNYVQAALICPTVREDVPIDLWLFHEMQGKRYIAAFLASAIMALLANVVYGGLYNLLQWQAENFAVVPMIAVASAALIFFRPSIQFGLALASMCVWAYFFIALQGALR